MTAFATYDDLALRMKRVFTVAEQEWVTTLLEDAASFLRGCIGRAVVYPVTTSTFTAYPSGGRIDLPQPFVVSVDSVTRDEDPVSFLRREDTLYVVTDDACDVEFTYGLAEPPNDLLALNCALVSGTITLVESDLGLQVGGLSSVALDDFKVAFADGGAGTGLTLPEPQLRYLRDAYGSTGWVVGSAP